LVAAAVNVADVGVNGVSGNRLSLKIHCAPTEFSPESRSINPRVSNRKLFFMKRA
jgi:hypothetical protein